jgi:hypothetical protein
MDSAVYDYQFVLVVVVNVIGLASGIHVSRHDLGFHDPCEAKAKKAPECLEKACGALA